MEDLKVQEDGHQQEHTCRRTSRYNTPKAVIVNSSSLSPTTHIAKHGNDTNGTLSLWFTETAFHQRFNGRQACAIESACLHKPTFHIELLTTTDVTSDSDQVRLLTRLPNFRWTKMNLSSIFHWMPLELWYESRIWKTGKQPIEDLSDGLRYTVLWKRGGIYLDLDVLATRPLTGLKNCAVYETGTIPSNSILFFDKSHEFLWSLQKTCAEVYSTVKFGSCGPSLMHRVSKSKYSKNVTFLNASTFFGVEYEHWKWFFEPQFSAQVLEKVRNSYGVHLWNAATKHFSDAISRSGSAYDALLRSNCPRVYELMNSSDMSLSCLVLSLPIALVLSSPLLVHSACGV